MSSTSTFTYKNTGNTEVVVTSVEVTSGTAFSIIDTPVMPHELSPGEDMHVEVQASSMNAGTAYGTISVQSDAAASPYTTGLVASFFNPETGGSIEWPKIQSPAVGAFVSISPEINLGDFTLEYWAKVFSDPSPSQFGRITDSSTLGLVTNYRAGPNIAIEAGPFSLATNGGDLTLDQWIHWAFVRTGNVANIYKNGSLVRTSTVSTGLKAFSVITIGSTGGEPCAGRMSDLRYWNVARSQAQIAANYLSRIDPNQAGLFAYYKLNQPTNDFADATGNYPNLTRQLCEWNSDAPPPFA